MPTLWSASARFLLRHPWQLLLAIVGIALGVATFTAVSLATQSAERALRLSLDAVNGSATHRLVGGPAGIPETFYTALRTSGAVHHLAPVVEGYALVNGHAVRVLGVDVFAERDFRNWHARAFNRGLEFVRGWLTQSGAVMVSAHFAAQALSAEAAFDVQVAGRTFPAHVVGTLDAESGGVDDLLVMDIAQAQEWLGSAGMLSRIELRLPPGAQGQRELDAIRQQLPPGVEIVATQRLSQETGGLTSAFTTNLRALSLLALLVSGFLILNAMAFAVIQRRSLFGVLRALGVTCGQLFVLIAVEAAVLGTIGAGVGAWVGIWFARQLLALVTRTINDLYFVVSVNAVTVSGRVLAVAIGSGIAIALLAALLPAIEAARAPPQLGWRRSVLEAHAARSTRVLALLSMLLVAAGTALVWFTERSLSSGFAALACFLIAAAFLTPAALAASATLVAALVGRFSLVGRLAIGGLERSLSRTGIAIAALSIAVAATIGIAVMVSSFRGSLHAWLERTLRADIYVTAPGPGFSRPERALDAQVVTEILARPEIIAHSATRRVQVDSSFGTLALDALEPAPASCGGFTLLSHDPEQAWQAFLQGGLLVSEPLAWRHSLAVGARIDLQTPNGRQAFPVAGIYRDYGNERGGLVMERSHYRAQWHDDAITGMGLYVAPGVDAEKLASEIAGAAAKQQALLIRSTRAVLALSMQIFERTFAITRVLYWLAAAVAMIGLLAALLAYELDRARELAVLRALGLSPAGVAGLVGTQTVFMGLAAGIAAIPTGLLVAYVLVDVVNRRAFGWQLDFHLQGADILTAFGLALSAALLAGLYPAWRSARAHVASAIREE